jgi:HAD superfamily hydrolase (TIGR01509 family)
MKRFILWDNDGVLVDTEYWYFKATQQALMALGIELSLQTYHERMVHGASSWDLARLAGVDPEKIARQQRQRDADYRQYLLREQIDIPGVEEVLQALSKSYRMGVVTTSTRPHFELIHNNRKLIRHMEIVLTREDYVASKPNPEPYLLAMQLLGATAEECLVVEDSRRGLQAAMAAGIDCAVVYNQFTASHDFTGARHLLGSIIELPGIIDDRRN